MVKEQKNILKNELISECLNIINLAKKPIVLLGGGTQENWLEIREYLQKINIPVLSTLRGLGVVNDTNYHGWIGHTGFPWSNEILFEADTILVLGSRLDIRQTGSETYILDEKKVIHVDIDTNELDNCRVKNTIKINSTVVDFLEAMSSKIVISSNKDWEGQIKNIEFSHKLGDDGKSHGVNPSEVLKYIDKIINNMY